MSRDNIVKRFGRRIRQVRESKGMNQTVLAERIGTDQSTISLIENGRQEPRLTFIEMLAKGLKVPICDLFRDL